jgi:hypothetical protein
MGKSEMRQGCFTAAILAAAILLPACAATRAGDAQPALAATPAAAEPAEPPPQPLLRHEASAECWMKHDKSGGSLEAKTKLVGKCIDERMKAQKPQ